MMRHDRRRFLTTSAAGLLGGGFACQAMAQMPGERPPQDRSVEVLNPRARVPVSLIIDDSTCLVNLNRFAIPQFAAAWGNQRYFQRCS